jgi:hypothetical protein
MKTTPIHIGLICIVIQCIHSYAAVPADYRGTPFDDAVYRAQQKALADKKRPLPSDFIPVQVLFDSKIAVVGSGWVAHGGTACSIALSEKDAEGKQVIEYRSKHSAFETFGWNWAKPEDPAVDLTKFDAISFSVKVTGPLVPDQMFFSITDIDPCPIPLRDYDPKFEDGAWHTITIPLADFKWIPAGKVTDRTEVRGVTFMTYNWGRTEYKLDFDHFALCHSTKPLVTAAKPPAPVAPTTKGQVIPGRLQCAFYDLGGEGIAYHDTDAINILSAVLNQQKGHQRPAANPYYWNFRKDEGVDISYTKDIADYNHPERPNLFSPDVNQLYIGATHDGEWCNYTVDVKKPGKYKIISLYGFGANVIKFSINNVPASVCKLPVDTGSFHIWNKAEVGSIEFKEAGPQLLTLFVSRNNFAYFDFEPMDEPSKQ